MDLKSTKVSVVGVEDFNVSLSIGESIKYDDIVNFERSPVRSAHRCVMCGLINGKDCFIPNQNKDVCKVCDSAFWRVIENHVVVKFCKGYRILLMY